MIEINEAKAKLIYVIEKLQEKKSLSETVGEDYYDPGNMEYLDKYLGEFDPTTNNANLRVEAKGLRYEGRTERLDKLKVGDSVKLVRDPGNIYNSNNFIINNKENNSIGNLPAELCNAIAPLFDSGNLKMVSSRVSYVERLRDRSRYATQGVLFIEIKLQLTL